MREKIVAIFLTVTMLAILVIPIMAATYTLGSYSAPFCVNGVCSFFIVYGSDAKPADLVGGSDVIIRLGADSYTLVSSTGGTETSVTGEGTRLDTASNRIIPGECINNAKTTVTDTDMPTVLADGTMQADDGTDYPYTQDIVLGSTACMYLSDSDNDIEDPAYHLEMVATSGSPVYTTRITFSKAAPLNSSDIVDNAISLFGGEYTVSSSTDHNTLVLFGGANTQIINEGEEVTVTVGGTEYTVGVGGVSSSTVAVVVVDGESESMTQGNTKKISGLDVYLSAVYYYPKEGQISQAKVTLGSQKITFEHGDEVLIGTNTYIDETAVTITNSGTKYSKIEVSTPAQDSDEDHVLVGGKFEDPVWGTFSLELSSLTPALDADAGDVITLAGSSDTASIKFTDYGGTEATIPFAYDNNTASGAVSAMLMDSSSYEYIVAEGANVTYKNYLVVDKADDTHLLQLSNVPGGAIKTTDILRFTDVFSGTTYEHTFSTSELGTNRCGHVGANVTMRIGSQDYYVMVCNATTKANSHVVVTWDDTNSYSSDAGAGFGVVGNRTLFPQIKGENGEYIIFVNNYTYVDNASFVVLPSSGTTKTAQGPSGTAGIYRQTATTWLESSLLNYTLDNLTAATSGVRVVPTPLKDYFSGIMILEEERADNTYHAIYIGITQTGTTTLTVKVAQPTFTDTESTKDGSGGIEWTTWGSDTYYSEAIDAWGTMARYYNKDEAEAVITYPDTQVFADLYILSEGAVTSTSATGSGTIKKAVPISDSISKLDTDIPSPATVDQDLILVGGSCVNDLVQKLVDDGKLDAKYTCTGGLGEGWESGKGYIWLIEDCFKTGQTCLIAAGTSKEGTRTACSVLQKYDTLLADSTATAIEVTSATTAGITPL